MTKQAEEDKKIAGRGSQMFQGEWIYASILIGIISLIVSISIYLSGLSYSFYEIIPLPFLSFFIIFIIIILSVSYINLRKMPVVSLLKVSVVAIAVSIILVAAMLSPFILPMLSSEPILLLTKLDYEPEYYVEITPEELEDFPTLQGLNNKSIYGRTTQLETTKDEKNRIIDLLTQKKLEQYYPFEMWVSTNAWGMDEIPAPTLPAYIEITAEELELFPSFKMAVVEPDTWHGISSDEWDSFLEFTKGYHDQNGIFIKFGNQLYQTRNTEDIRSRIKNTESYIKVEGEYYRFRVAPVG
ncbi:MAG: hypothetical protein KAQ85_03370 [Thermodesulfovibrionia bacterium]|nr:hypothetical protein [Thermodesulfovibrionia bacterium]